MKKTLMDLQMKNKSHNLEQQKILSYVDAQLGLTLGKISSTRFVLLFPSSDESEVLPQDCKYRGHSSLSRAEHSLA